MQTPKASIKSSSGSEGAQRISPRSVSIDTTQKSSSRVVRQLKTTSLETNSLPKTRSPKISDRASTRGPVATEKKRVGRVAELETQVSQLEDALRTDQNDDEAWNSTHSSALATALLEIDQLKVKLDTAIESEANQTKEAESAYTEIYKLKENMSETLSLMEEMKNQLENSKCSESHAQALASETLLQLETAKKTMESLKLNSDEHNTIILELDHSRARVRLLEDIIEKMKTTNLANEAENESKQVISGLKSKLTSLETDLCEKSDENEKLKLELKKMNGLVEASKQDSNILNSGLANVETELREKSDENKTLKLEIKKMNHDFNSLKSNITSLETEVCNKSEENEKLKLEIKKADGVVEAVKMSKCEVEEELKRLKVQMSQWRKAAEAATAMLCDESSDNNSQKLVDRTK
ncbi:interactor of constitutive active ROPs 3-like protein isoform X1 [Tanacetum coccineum]